MSTLAELAELEADWDTYQAKPISPAAIATAQNLTFVPCPDGGIQIEMHAGGADIEIEIAPDGTVASVYWGKP